MTTLHHIEHMDPNAILFIRHFHPPMPAPVPNPMYDHHIHPPLPIPVHVPDCHPPVPYSMHDHHFPPPVPNPMYDPQNNITAVDLVVVGSTVYF